MPRTPGSRTSRITQTSPTGIGGVGFDYGTSSDFDGSNFEDPKDISDIAGIESDIGGSRGTPPRRPPMGGIDLGKGLDLEKPKPPRSPIGIEIGKSPSGNLGVGVEVPIGLSPFGARGGVAIDPATGQVRGGYGGLGIGKGAIGASVDVGIDDGGCFQYVTVSAGPFSHTYGRNVCEPKMPKEPSTQIPSPVNKWDVPLWPVGDPNKFCETIVAIKFRKETVSSTGQILEEYEYESSGTYVLGSNTNSEIINATRTIISDSSFGLPSTNPTTYQNCSRNSGVGFAPGVSGSNRIYNGNNASHGPSGIIHGFSGQENRVNGYLNTKGKDLLGFFSSDTRVRAYTAYTVIYSSCSLPTHLGADPPSPNSPNFPPPLSNPPPKKMNNDNDCCKLTLALQLETLRLLGREVGPSGLIQQSKKIGFLGEEIERIETPIMDPTNPKKVKIQFLTIYDLLKYTLKQANNLDTALDPQSYKTPTGFLQNPRYNRDSEESLKTNKQPDKDKAGNKRELEINKDDEARISGFLQQQSYAFQMLRRLEYLFPFGELEDALIAKSLLIPGAEGEIKIHNMIQAYEIQMQYINAALGDPREVLTIKDANPAIEGDQPIEVRSLSISDLLRQNIKFHIDTGGDVDALINLVLRDFRTNLASRLDQVKTAEMVQALFEDSGMLEKQEYIDVHLEGDPYAGQWVKGQGFNANPDLEKRTEEATEKVLRETMKPVNQRVKVSRRSKDEKTDMRDLLRALADFIQRLLSIPSAGDAATAIDKLVESAKFKVQTDMALIRQNVSKAATASRNRTRKGKK
jgi:hypothetical protein